MLVFAVFATLQVVSLFLWATPGAPRTRASIAAACLTLADALCLTMLSHMEHLRSVRPSAIINIYLLLSLPCDIARARSLWLSGHANAIAAVFSSTVSVKAALLVTEAIEKRDILLGPYQTYSPEATSGIYTRSFFWWLNPLFRDGFKRVLTDEDLHPIDEDMSAISLQRRLQGTWIKSNKESEYALLFSVLKALRSPLLLSVFPRLCLIFFRYMQPLLISRTVKFVSAKITPLDTNEGWGLVAAYALVYTCLGIFNGAYFHTVYRMITMLRGSLVSVIYAKTVELSVTAVDESVAVTLMATDTERICLAAVGFHEIWGGLIEIGIAVWLLEKQMGVAAVAPAVVAILSSLSVFFMASRMGEAQKIWVEGIQTRINVTKSMLGSMKGVKMLGLTKLVQSTVDGLRQIEIRKSSKLRYLIVARIFFAFSTELLGPAATFVVFVLVAEKSGRTFDVSSAFTALSVISLMTSPLNQVIQYLPSMIAALACFKRIQDFLLSDVRKDHRIYGGEATARLKETVRVEQAPASEAEGIELRQLNRLPTQTTFDIAAIVAQNASFSWKADGPPVVKDATFTIPLHRSTFIVGPVGSGKSTLVKGLLGETPSTKGFVYVSSLQAAFVDQTSWIENGSLRDNVLGISRYDMKWYDAVLRACALDEDLKQFPNGDETKVGSAGISLSGGQKQRLALARAVYSEHETIVLDDVFSGLDATTEEKIFSRLFGKKGLLRTKGITIILITHAVHRLTYADHIIAMGADGTIAEEGSFAQLRSSGGYVEQLAKQHQTEESEIVNEEEAPKEVKAFKPTGPDANTEQINLDLTRQIGDAKVYGYYFKSIGWHRVIVFVLNFAAIGFLLKFPQLWVTFWTEAVVEEGNSANPLYLGVYVALEGLAGGVLIFACWHVLCVIVPVSAIDLHQKLLKTVMNAPLSFFTTTDAGTTLNRFSQDMTIVDIELPDAMIDFSVGVVLTVMESILMSLSAGYFTATLPVVMIILYILQMFYLRTSRQIRLMDLEAKSPLYANFLETLTGLITIRSFGWASNFQERNLRLLDTSQKPYYVLFCIQRWLALILDLVVAGLATILMVLMVKLRGTISPAYVGLALLNVMDFNLALTTIVKSWTQLETSIGAISRLRTFEADTENENKLPETEQPSSNWPVHGTIQFNNLSASYTADPSSSNVLHNLTLHIEAGQKIGICGRSGSGKSSLITSLFRMLEIQSGSISIDGVDLRSLTRQDIRAALNAIPQEPIFISGSVRLNVDPFGLRTDSEIESTLRKVRCWDIISQKGGLDVDMDGEGFFSHGQRQLFCLARALLKGGRVIVLDEATSSVDVETDALMQKLIRDEFRGCTIVVVAHRLDTILDFDRVAVLGRGKLIEFDEPGRLLARESAFKELYEAHMGDKREEGDGKVGKDVQL
ncbi:hypothetical protein MMC25_005044 [Agyrium rufum]|nr:hypothetical protein [Agyrium rufum]